MTELAELGGVSLVTPKSIRPGQGLWLMSDLHIGAGNVDYGRIEREVAAAVRRGDRVLINGDVFDAIVAGDPRHAPTVMHRALHDTDHPLDAAADLAAALLAPAVRAGLLDYLGHGNHETAVDRRAGLSLLSALRLRLADLGPVPPPAGYCGFCTYRVKGGGRASIFAHHGSKTGAGLTQLARLAGCVDADLIWLGHFHQKQSTGGLIVSASPDGRAVQVRERRRVMTGGYSFAYGASPAGQVVDRYAAVAALPPGLLGGARVVVNWSRRAGLALEVCS